MRNGERFFWEQKELGCLLKGILSGHPTMGMGEMREKLNGQNTRQTPVKNENGNFLKIDIFAKNFIPTSSEKKQIQENFRGLATELEDHALLCCCLEKNDHGFAGHLNISSTMGKFFSSVEEKNLELVLMKLHGEISKQVQETEIRRNRTFSRDMVIDGKKIEEHEETSNHCLDCYSRNCSLRNPETYQYWTNTIKRL